MPKLIQSWRWTLPILTIAVVDLAIRWRQLIQWQWWEDLFYLLSVVLVLAWVRVVAGLLPDRQRHPRIYWPAIAVLGAISGFILLIHYDYYFYFGVHPEIIALTHVVRETAESVQVVQDELTPLRFLLGALLIGLCVLAWRITTDPRPRRMGFWASLAVVIVLSPAFQLNVAMSQGNFLPSVNFIFTAGKAIQFALEGKGAFRRMQVSSRIPVPAQPEKLPYNVLILVNESLRAKETGYNGYARDTTPNVDAFLKAHPDQTFSFSKCYTNSTKTSESVPSILTGVHPMEDYLKLHRFPLFYEYPKAFPDTVSFLYAAHGYDVANFRFFLRTPRLDKMVYQENSGHPRFNSLGMDDKYLLPPFEKTIAELPPDKRFAGILHMNGPHFPYRVPDEFLKWGTEARQDEYDNSIRYQDRTIGGFLQTLQVNGRLANTIIFSTSDHGEAFGEHGVNGHRHTFYEEIIHIPCWMYLPEPLAKRYAAVLHKNEHQNVTNLDWVPTLIDLLGLEKNPEVAKLVAQMHGRSMVEPQDPQRLILVQNGTNGQRLSDGFGIVRGHWRLLDHPLGLEAHFELYDLSHDGGEKHNLWDSAPRAELEEWRNVLEHYPLLEHRTAKQLEEDIEGASHGAR